MRSRTLRHRLIAAGHVGACRVAIRRKSRRLIPARLAATCVVGIVVAHRFADSLGSGVLHAFHRDVLTGGMQDLHLLHFVRAHSCYGLQKQHYRESFSFFFPLFG